MNGLNQHLKQARVKEELLPRSASMNIANTTISGNALIDSKILEGQPVSLQFYSTVVFSILHGMCNFCSWMHALHLISSGSMIRRPHLAP